MQRFSQGEVNFIKIHSAPTDATEIILPEGGRYIVGHSESGNLHVLDAEEVTLCRRPGADVLYAIVANPTQLRQEKSDAPHAPIPVDPGVYRIVISREFNPFMNEARRVAD